jgi:hypothetical protein
LSLIMLQIDCELRVSGFLKVYELSENDSCNIGVKYRSSSFQFSDYLAHAFVMAVLALQRAGSKLIAVIGGLCNGSAQMANLERQTAKLQRNRARIQKRSRDRDGYDAR